MTTEQIQTWLDADVEAWRSHDRDAIARGETRSTTGDVFSNRFELEFAADGRCASFVEWYVHHPKA